MCPVNRQKHDDRQNPQSHHALFIGCILIQSEHNEPKEHTWFLLPPNHQFGMRDEESKQMRIKAAEIACHEFDESAPRDPQSRCHLK